MSGFRAESDLAGPIGTAADTTDIRYTQYVLKRHPIRDVVLILERLRDRL